MSFVLNDVQVFLNSGLGYGLVVGVFVLYHCYPQIKRKQFIRKRNFLDDEIAKETFLVSTSQTFDFIFWYLMSLTIPTVFQYVSPEKGLFINTGIASAFIFLHFGIAAVLGGAIGHTPLNTLASFSSFSYGVNRAKYIGLLLFCAYSIATTQPIEVTYFTKDAVLSTFLSRVILVPLILFSTMSYNWVYESLSEGLLPEEENSASIQ